MMPTKQPPLDPLPIDSIYIHILIPLVSMMTAFGRNPHSNTKEAHRNPPNALRYYIASDTEANFIFNTPSPRNLFKTMGGKIPNRASTRRWLPLKTASLKDRAKIGETKASHRHSLPKHKNAS